MKLQGILMQMLLEQVEFQSQKIRRLKKRAKKQENLLSYQSDVLLHSMEKADIVDARFRSIHSAVIELKKQLIDMVTTNDNMSYNDRVQIIIDRDQLINAQLDTIFHDSDQEAWDEPF